jgi:hypothetical protein
MNIHFNYPERIRGSLVGKSSDHVVGATAGPGGARR